MTSSRLFAACAALCVAFAVAMTAAAVGLSAGRDALQVDELLRVEPLPEALDVSVDDHLSFAFEAFSGTRPWTQADLEERFTPGFVQNFDAERLNQLTADSIAETGPSRLVRVTDRQDDSIRALGVAEDGTPMAVWIQAEQDGRIESLLLEEIPAPPRRPVYETTLLLFAGWLSIGAAASQRRPTRDRWILLAYGAAATSGVLILSDGSSLYTLGRTVPLLLPVFAVMLLAPARRAGRLLLAASVATLPAVLTPFVRDAGLIGHPDVWGAFADSASAYRWLLLGASVSIAVTMFALATARISGARSTHRRPTAAELVGTAAAGLWAIVMLGITASVAAGAPEPAMEVLDVLILCAVVMVPAAAVLQLMVDRFNDTGLAALVVDLDADGTNLESAIAKALSDPTLRLVTSEDGDIAEPDSHNPDQSTTEIRSGGRLVGVLLHDPALRRTPERLQAVAATAGMALEVARLNRQVTAQLDEVNRSRTRIIQAGDTARRRIERDLHDGAQQRLVALAMRLQLARRAAGDGGDAAVVELLDDATCEVRRSLEDMRAVSRGAQPALLAERGLGPAIDALAERSPIPVQLDITSSRSTPDVERTAYFIVAEALTNIARHAGATEATVAVTLTDRTLHVCVTDNGRGGALPSPGSGLEGIADRAAAAGGSMALTSNDSGTTVEAVIPCG